MRRIWLPEYGYIWFSLVFLLKMATPVEATSNPTERLLFRYSSYVSAQHQAGHETCH